ncbi:MULTISPECIES: hypothetical protein [Shouchella]|uniref:Uncharacterized protein n=2 Tax=Shouchella TaxID=2893057 RepID=A0ABY7W3J7_9BACI|nr:MULTISPECIES: hypothetical protein [Shouchella]MED4129377.1 hypothetical protein [Shouchella miscanthi]WDF02472.1 hypothetical protein PQ477_13180 [Shouchella hunanensis]GAF24237.1 hypothetical protein JCM19047_4114 [Bacillus sp. JCM 19047]
MEELAEDIIVTIQAEEKDWLRTWDVQGYIPMDQGVLLYVTRKDGQKVVVSIQTRDHFVYQLELLRNNDKFDRIVLGGTYDVEKDQLGEQINQLLTVYH